jgi:hypothetical protein
MAATTSTRSASGYETHDDERRTNVKDVFAIYESKTEGRERSQWVRVGVAFENEDGSLNVLLDALPLRGRLQIRNREGDGARAREQEAPR